MKRNSPFRNIGQYIKKCCRTHPEAVALHIRKGFTVERYTYREMYDLMERYGSYLMSIGIRRGEKVLIWGPNMPEWAIALGGILMAGAVAVPVSLHATPETVDEYIRQTKSKYLVRSSFVNDSERKNARCIVMEEVMAVSRKTEKRTFPVIKPNDLAEIMYTSGTTGDPSGVMLTHGNILEGLEGLKHLVPPSKEYRLLSILPLSHALEQLLGLLTFLHFGATIYYLPRINPVVIVRALKHYHITHFVVVPELLKVMWNAVEFQAQQHGSLGKLRLGLRIAPFLPLSLKRALFRDIHGAFGGKLSMFGCAGAPLDRWVAANWEKVGVAVLEGYGLTETSAALTANQINARRLGSVGKILPGVAVKFAEDGEIMTKGLNVTPGYFKNVKKTRESFTKDGYFKTGDVGYVGKDGYVYLTGRKKFKIVTPTGEKVYPEDVERVLNDNPAVKESCVIGIRKGVGEVVHAVLILKRDVDPTSIISWANERLESHQTILQWSLWDDDDFPRTRSLKKDRNKVKSSISGEKTLGQEQSAAGSQTGGVPAKKDTVAEILAMVCSIRSDEIKDDMSLVFDLHLDSLRRVTLVSMIEEEMGITVDEQDIDEKMKVSGLRKLVSKGEAAAQREEYPTWPLDPTVVFLRNLFRTLLAFPFSKLLMSRVTVENAHILKSMKVPSIIVFNHVGHMEPVMILTSLPRHIQKRIATLAESRVYSNWWRRFHMYFTACAFPLETTGGPVRRSLELGADLLESGWSLLLSPEGRISDDGTLKPFKLGTSALAIETGVPVYPVKVKGYREAQLLLRKDVFDVPRPFSRVTLVFGEPLYFDSSTFYDEATAKIRKTIEEL